MTYNSQESILTIPEYGRHIQNLVAYAKTIEDDKERQTFAEQVVNLMYQMNPQSKNILEYKTKLWKHFFLIADFDINVVSPDGSQTTEAEIQEKPDSVPYPVKEREFRHYGHNVRLLMEKAIAMEDGDKKDGFVEVIASFMKLAYKNWNREHYVSDEIILEDLKSLSKGKLQVSENSSLDTLTSAVRYSKPKRHSKNSNRGRRSGGHKHKRRR